MQTFEYLSRVHQALSSAVSREENPERRQELDVLRQETWARLRSASGARSMVFALHPGFVWLGDMEKPRAFQWPNLQGLEDAWTILLHWTVAQYAVHAGELDGSPSGNALNGRLKTAIEWVEDTAGCRDLGHLLRQIQVGRDGTVTPPRIDFDIRLHL